MSVATMTSTTEQPTSKKSKKERKKFYKLTIRHLPCGITLEELKSVLNVNPEPMRLWLRPGEPYLEHDAFPYGFIVFDNFDVAARFQQHWHGKTISAAASGEESVILVEKAINSDWTKYVLNTAKKIKPITENLDYIKFVEEAESRCITKQVDFDVLVNEIIEREAKLAAGAFQETPLTDFFVKRAHDKLMKARGKMSNVKSESFGASEKSTKKERPFHDKKKDTRPSRGGPKEKKEQHERKPLPKQPVEVSTSDSTVGVGSSEKMAKQPREMREFRRRTPRVARVTKADGDKPTPMTRREAPVELTSSKPTIVQKVEQSREPLSEATSTTKPGFQKKPLGVTPGKNKDRPERPLYQPGRGRRYRPGGGSAAGATDTPATIE